MLSVVGSSLKMVKFEPTTPNMLQHGGQTHATCFARQCCDTLRSYVAIVWPGINTKPGLNVTRSNIFLLARLRLLKLQNEGAITEKTT